MKNTTILYTKYCTLKAHVAVMQWSPNGKLLATGSKDCTVIVWNFDPVALKLSHYKVPIKGVEPSPTFAWPGWKQPDIPVEVDTARLETSRLKNDFVYYYTTLEVNSRVLLMYTDTVKELPGYPVQNSPSGSFLL